MKRNEFFNVLNYIGCYPLQGIDLVEGNEEYYAKYRFSYMQMRLHEDFYGDSAEDIKEQIEEYKNQIANGVITYEIPFDHINSIIAHITGWVSEDGYIVNYAQIYSKRLLTDKFKNLIKETKYLWEINPEIFMANLNLSEDETYEIDYENDKVIVTRTLTPNSFAKEALKVQKSPLKGNIYTYNTIHFESDLSLHEIRLQMGYDDSKEL